MSTTDIPDAEASTDLPDRQVPWGDAQSLSLCDNDGNAGSANGTRDAQELAGMTVHSNTEPFYSDTSRGSLYEHSIAYVADGVDSFKEDAREVVVVPIYYSRFDDFGTEVLLPTLASTASGYGITPRRLEAAVRVATGGGSYHSNDLAVYVTDGEPRFLVEYQDDAFLCSAAPIDRLGDPETWNVRGMQVPEGDVTYRNALERLLDALTHFDDYEVTGYSETRDGKHVFETNTEKPLYVKSSDLRSVAGTTESRDEMPDEVAIETEYDEQFEVSWDDIAYDVGDAYDEWLHDDPGVVVGLQVNWEDPRTSSRVSMSGKITVDGTYVVVKPRRYTGDRSYHELTVERETVRLGEFEPTKEDWDPIGNHL